ncbi:Carboxy-S-adenosyl-L-methionine synthase [Trichinella spiralis]|uniref:Carboxy-S-adenosyl-L-methionine synthase n=1 Tax=Trichinella spiralis TaxID=6334 RepID=A0ABR3KTY4_TRISP
MVMALQFIIALDSPALASQPIAKLATWIVDLVGIEFFPVTRDEVDFTNFTQTSPAETKRYLSHKANVYDHTTLKAPHPARSAKLSNVGLTSVPESETVWEHAVS